MKHVDAITPNSPTHTTLRRRWLLSLACLTACSGWALLSSPLFAHDGGFGHSRRTIAFFADDTGWTIEYRLRLNADEALLQLAEYANDDDPDVIAANIKTLPLTEAQRVVKGLKVRDTTGRTLPLQVLKAELGPSFTQTFIFRCASRAGELDFDDANFPHKPGVVQIVAGAGVEASHRTAIDIHHAEQVPLRIRRTASTKPSATM